MALDGLARGLTALGHTVEFRRLRTRTGVHTFDRWLYNRQVAASPPKADLVVGVDLDGFLWAARRPPTIPRFVVALKGIIADERRNERGLVRALLGVQARWERANVAVAECVVVPSAYSASVAEVLYGVDARRIAVVPEPIDLAEWRRRFAAVAPAAEPCPPTVLCVARMYPRKRIGDLLRAAALLRARIPDLRVRIVGEGPESAPLRALHTRLALGETVAFLGDISRQALAVEYMRAHCFCLPTVQEGFGIVFAEAMAAGLPIVACRAAAVPEVVEDRRTGLLVSPRAPEELAMAMETLLRNPGLSAQMGDAGRARADRFGMDAVASRFLTAVGA